MNQQVLSDALDLVTTLRPKLNSSAAPDQIHVDPNFIEDPNVTPVIEYAINRRKNLFLVGPTGCGKSSLAINVAARLGEAVEIFNCNGETSTDELIAKPWRKSSGETVSIPGAALRAYSTGRGLLLEEVDHANPDILAALHRIMELNQNFVKVNVGEGETYKRDPRFFVMATANTIGTGEDTFMYAGTKPLNAAFMNRFSLTIKMDFLTADKEVSVLMNKTGAQKGLCEKMVSVAGEARALLKTDTDRIATVVSTRDLLEWADLVVSGNQTPVTAAEFVFLNRANEADRDVLSKLVTNHF